MFEPRVYPKDGRMSKYEAQLLKLMKKHDREEILQFSRDIFRDCGQYLTRSFELKIPPLYLNLMNHAEYTKQCDLLDLLLGRSLRTDAMILYKEGSPPEICVDFETVFSYFTSTKKPMNFVANLTANYIEQLVHSAYPSKSEMDVHELVCYAIEGFTEIELTLEMKEERAKYAQKVDSERGIPRRLT